ncbi:hypothetical protein A8144_02155 [Mycobacterium leprae 3125609]|nr:hypothetical protein [Mycobacterium leprae]OAR20823.1 hypothetical protein A8144_02155 [Mycobacterium leprae 3125609]OAX72027.1 hypothetical protein A3216_02240 [Mycobacterium leprae 7935681]
MIAGGRHTRTEVFTSLMVLFSTSVVVLEFPLADPIIGIVIIVAILTVLSTAARDVCCRLVDEMNPANGRRRRVSVGGLTRGAGGAQRADALNRSPPAH